MCVLIRKKKSSDTMGKKCTFPKSLRQWKFLMTLSTFATLEILAFELPMHRSPRKIVATRRSELYGGNFFQDMMNSIFNPNENLQAKVSTVEKSKNELDTLLMEADAAIRDADASLKVASSRLGQNKITPNYPQIYIIPPRRMTNCCRKQNSAILNLKRKYIWKKNGKLKPNENSNELRSNSRRNFPQNQQSKPRRTVIGPNSPSLISRKN